MSFRIKKINVGIKQKNDKDQIGLTLIGENRTFEFSWPKCRCGRTGTLERRQVGLKVEWKLFCKNCEQSSPVRGSREDVVQWWKAVMTLKRE